MDPVLVAVDPTGPADAQEQLGLVLARATGAEIVLATVFPMIHLRSYVHSRSYETRLRQEAERFLAGRAEALRRRVPELTIETKTTGAASAAHGLHRLARELDASVVVLGPSRRRGRGLSVPGPMGSRFAHGAPCPVAVAPAEGPIRAPVRIGAAFADTDDGRHALRGAASLAERAGASLRVIAVAGPLPWMDLVEPEFDGRTLHELYQGHVAYVLSQAVADLPDSLAVESEVASGNPVDVLASASGELDLLVCGSRGHGPVGEVVLGSTSHALLEAARCPMLIVPRVSGHARDDQSRRFAA
jgi:nucleotide-binding universal stress UspA family protein